MDLSARLHKNNVWVTRGVQGYKMDGRSCATVSLLWHDAPIARKNMAITFNVKNVSTPCVFVHLCALIMVYSPPLQ